MASSSFEHLNIEAATLNSPTVQRLLYTNGVFDPEKLLEAQKIYTGLAALRSKRVTTFLGVLMSLIWSRIFPYGVSVDEDKLTEIKNLQRTKATPIILVPTHKSHIDYMILGYFMITRGLESALIVAGDNLRFFFVGTLLKYCGAIFIRRRFGDDKLYAAVFQTYVCELMKASQTIQCFLEGGRSRTGKVMSPKAGFMSVAINAVIDGDVDDCILFPISISYDQVIEKHSMVSELHGQSKEEEGIVSFVIFFWKFLISLYNRILNFGRVEVNIAEPISVQNYISQRTSEKGRYKEALMNAQTRLRLASSLGYRVLHECNIVAVILPAMVVGTILANCDERALRDEELVANYIWISNQIRLRGGRVHSYGGSIQNTINTVVNKIFGNKKSMVVKRFKGMIITNAFTPVERLELSTYRNGLIHWFLADGFTALGIHSLLAKTEHSSKDPPWLSYEAVAEACAFLSSLFRFEFVFSPSDIRDMQKVEQTLKTTLINLSENKVLTLKYSGKKITSVRLEKSLFESQHGSEEVNLYPKLLRMFFPFVDSYIVAAISCFAYISIPKKIGIKSDKYILLDGEPWLEMRVLVKHAQLWGESLYFDGKIDYYEATNSETLTNAFVALSAKGVLKKRYHNGARIFTLNAPEFTYNNHQNLRKLIGQIFAFRKNSRVFSDRVVDDCLDYLVGKC